MKAALKSAADPAAAARGARTMQRPPTEPVIRGGQSIPATIETDVDPHTRPGLWAPADAGRNPHLRPGRVGKSNVTGYFRPEVKQQLRILAAERNTTIQVLLAEALNMLFAQHKKPEIA